MSTKEKLVAISITILLSVFSIIPIYEFKVSAKTTPRDLYRVYLNGKNIGVIESKEKLEKYINEDQKELKDEFGVDTVYLPKGLYISKYSTYNATLTDEKDIYETIKQTEHFTIKGYTITIKKEDENKEDIKINVLNKTDFENAVTSVVKAFVPNEELDVFLSGEYITIKDTGKKIEDLYIKEDIKIKESYISSDEQILLDERSVTKYLLFGEDIDEKKYIVKAGDTIESIAEDNKLAVEELLVVNQDLKSKNNLLSIGEEISVALISPVITVVEEEHLVEVKTIPYATQIEYDNSLGWGLTKIKQEGKDGSQIVTQKLKYENGEIIRALISDTKVIDEVINQVKVIGTMSSIQIDPSDIPDAGDWYWPTLQPSIITSPYGWRWGALHDGTDISGTGNGSPIFAANNGVVYKVFYDGIGGYQIIIAHENNYYTWYAHLSAQYVTAGQKVTRGTKIGAMGCTGSACTGPHLHFGAYKGIPGRGGISFNAMTLYR